MVRDNAAPTPMPAYHDLMQTAAANGHSLTIMNGEGLIRLLHGAGGGLAQGNAALANSLAAQSQTIAVQAQQIQGLLAENIALTKRVAEAENAHFTERQWADKVTLARDAMAQQTATQVEMLNIVKAAASQIGVAVAPALLGALMGGARPANPAPPPFTPPAAAAPTEGRAQACGAPESEESGAAPSTEAAVAPEEDALPSSLSGAVRMLVERLSPETIDEILESASRPNPQIPGNAPSIVAVVQVLASSLGTETLERIKADVGEKVFSQAFSLLLSYAR